MCIYIYCSFHLIHNFLKYFFVHFFINQNLQATVSIASTRCPGTHKQISKDCSIRSKHLPDLSNGIPWSIHYLAIFLIHINNNPVNQISYNYSTTVGGIAILLDLDLSPEGLPEGNTYSVINSCLMKELQIFIILSYIQYFFLPTYRYILN